MPRKDSILEFYYERELFLGSVLCAGWLLSRMNSNCNNRTTISRSLVYVEVRFMWGKKHMVVTD